MVSLIDLAPPPIMVTVGKHKVPVDGIDITKIAVIVERYPEMATKIGALVGKEDVGYLEMALLLGPALGAIIAAATDNAGDEAEEAAANRLPLHVQVRFIAAIIKRTMPNGVGPFAQELKAAMAELGKIAPQEERPARGTQRVRLRAR